MCEESILEKCLAAQFPIKVYLKINFVRTQLSIWSTLFAGGMAGICNWLVAIPMDVVKSRLQVRRVIIIKFTMTMMMRIHFWHDKKQPRRHPRGRTRGRLTCWSSCWRTKGRWRFTKDAFPSFSGLYYPLMRLSRGAFRKKIRQNLEFCPNEGGRRGVWPNPNF